MKKCLLVSLFLLLCLSLTACGSGDKKPVPKDEPVTEISSTEAEIFFYEITSNYRMELLMKSEEELKAGVSPDIWHGLAPSYGEYSFDELTDEYTTEEERAFISGVYGADLSKKTFKIYKVSEVQEGVDYIFGSGRIDVNLWNNDNQDLPSRGIFRSAGGWFLCVETLNERFDTQIYLQVASSGGDGEAVVNARGLGVDKITDRVVYDLGTLEETTSDDGTVSVGFRKLENAAIDNFDYGADFKTNVSAMGVDTEGLGIISFIFGVKGVSIYLDHVELQQP